MAHNYYLEIGEVVKSFKCLMRINNYKRVITFAKNARKKEIYILAGNYLQNCDWHSTPALIKFIVVFYSKAKAFDHLARFYDQCAAVEIDEYGQYEKAIHAWKEALKYAKRSKSENKEEKTQ